jgi:hypothetical protein
MQARNDKDEPTLACDFTVMDTEQRERYRALRRQLSKDLHEARELEDGYTFRHSSEAEVLIALAEYVTLERLCCPFFDFAIEVGRDGGEVWLKMTGGQEAKRILQAAQGQDQDMLGFESHSYLVSKWCQYSRCPASGLSYSAYCA